MICNKCKKLLNKNGVKENKSLFCSHITTAKRYDYLGFEEKTAKHFKEKKPKDKTNSEFLEILLSKVL